MTKVLVFSKSNPIKDWEAAKWNLQFLCVESQQEAIHMLETNTIHVVVVDIEEREQEGLAFVSCLRGLQRFYLLPVILLAKDDTYESLAFHVFHCFDYVIKPIEKERLEKLLHWIDGRFDNKGAAKALVINTRLVYTCLRQRIFCIWKSAIKRCMFIPGMMSFRFRTANLVSVWSSVAVT